MTRFATYHGIVEGRVQGVGFRQFLERAANRLELSGWTRNLGDGSVEFIISGQSALVDSFLDICGKGPLLSEVRAVSYQEFIPSEQLPKPFEIRPTL